MPRTNNIMNFDRAFQTVRNELAEVGLLDDGLYLDHVELHISDYPSKGEQGYVFDCVGWWARYGFKPGVIYVPRDAPCLPYVPGMTLTDTIRHEFAHAWRTFDPRFFREGWFEPVFGATYTTESPKPLRDWHRSLHRSRRYQSDLRRCRTESGRKRLYRAYYRQEFITDYASQNACEDFAETFMFFLKYRNSMDRFEDRSNVMRKLRAVERIVARAARRIAEPPAGSYRIRSA